MQKIILYIQVPEVTVNGSVITFRPQVERTVYYQCGSHNNMGNSINVQMDVDKLNIASHNGITGGLELNGVLVNQQLKN